MNDDRMKGKIERFIDKPLVTIEKTVKDLGKDKRFVEFINDPGIAIEKGVKKGRKYIIYTGREIKNNVIKKGNGKRKKSKRK